MAKERIALIIIDQLRADYKDYFPECSKLLPYSAICDTNSIPTSTEAMHANISTGKYPKDHGFVSKSKRKQEKSELEQLIEKFDSGELTPLSSSASKKGYGFVCMCGKPELVDLLGRTEEYALVLYPHKETGIIVVNGINKRLKDETSLFLNIAGYTHLSKDLLPDGTRSRILIDVFKHLLDKCGEGSKLLSILALPSLDYIGHKYGPLSEETIEHVYFLDEKIAELIKSNDDILFVIAGDHGCRKTQKYLIEVREDDARFASIYQQDGSLFKNKGAIKFDSEYNFQDISYDGGILRVWFKIKNSILVKRDAEILTEYGTIIDLRLKQNENKQLPLEVLDNSRHDNLGDIVVVSNKDATFCKRTWLDPELIERKILKNQDLKKDELPIGEHGTYYAEDRQTLFMSNHDFGKNIFLNLQIRNEIEKVMGQ